MRILTGSLEAALRAGGREPAAAGKIFNITDGLRHTWREFLQTVTGRLGKKLRILPVPPSLLQFAALPLDLVSGFFGIRLDPVSYVTYFSEDLYFENSKARDLLNWQPRSLLTEGVDEMVTSYEKKQ